MDYRGHILDRQEVEYLTVLPSLEPRLKVVAEMGSAALDFGRYPGLGLNLA